MIDMTSKRLAERRLSPFDLVGVGLDVGDGRPSVERHQGEWSVDFDTESTVDTEGG
jgi:hypothetical protein